MVYLSGDFYDVTYDVRGAHSEFGEVEWFVYGAKVKL